MPKKKNKEEKKVPSIRTSLIKQKACRSCGCVFCYFSVSPCCKQANFDVKWIEEVIVPKPEEQIAAMESLKEGEEG